MQISLSPFNTPSLNPTAVPNIGFSGVGASEFLNSPLSDPNFVIANMNAGAAGGINPTSFMQDPGMFNGAAFTGVNSMDTISPLLGQANLFSTQNQSMFGSFGTITGDPNTDMVVDLLNQTNVIVGQTRGITQSLGQNSTQQVLSGINRSMSTLDNNIQINLMDLPKDQFGQIDQRAAAAIQSTLSTSPIQGTFFVGPPRGAAAPVGTVTGAGSSFSPFGAAGQQIFGMMQSFFPQLGPVQQPVQQGFFPQQQPVQQGFIPQQQAAPNNMMGLMLATLMLSLLASSQQQA